MTYSVLIEDIMVQKGIYWTIGEHLYIFNCPIVSYQMIKVYGVGNFYMGRSRCNNGSSGKILLENENLLSTMVFIVGDNILW